MPMKEEAIDLVSDWSEVALDHIAGNEIISGLPNVGSFVKTAKLVLDIRDKIFLNKIEAFLKGTANIPQEKKKEFSERIAKDPEFGRKLGELVLFSMDRSDSLEKASIVGHLFFHFITSERNEMDTPTFNRLLFAVDRAFIDDLVLLPKHVFQRHNLRLENLDGTGLTQIVYPTGTIAESGDTPKWLMSDLGRKYATFLLGFDPTRKVN